MTSDDLRAKAIFLEAVEKHRPETWLEYVQRACGGESHLQARVERLLKAHLATDSVLDHTSGVSEFTPELAVLPECRGTTIGPYRLVEEIGEGGFGVVFRAEQQQPVQRDVALKILKPGMDTRQVVARFQIERQALALMDHPFIAKVFDAGTTGSGRPYFAMELVSGMPITDHCDRHEMDIRERLQLFVELCEAVQHAHQKGVIHRDIKPGNVLVALQNGRPALKVIDFGVAKAINERVTGGCTTLTGKLQMLGTPLYMSPEQAELHRLGVDTRTDIYSLGVLLFELLTGTTPFDKERLKHASDSEIRRIICDEEPPRPSARIGGMSAAKRRQSPSADAVRRDDSLSNCAATSIGL
jgi:serine/threonine protein kinase